jgi:hypothetical protein
MYILNFKYFEVRKKVKGLTIPFGFQYACVLCLKIFLIGLMNGELEANFI